MSDVKSYGGRKFNEIYGLTLAQLEMALAPGIYYISGVPKLYPILINIAALWEDIDWIDKVSANEIGIYSFEYSSLQNEE